jgi:hypothetical protein
MITPSKHRGINRVVWNMRVKGPRVPRAAQVAFGSSQGPRVVPGTYTLRLTSGNDVIETKVAIGLDRRAPYTAADRKAQFDAMRRAGAVFDDMSTIVDHIEAVHEALEERAHAVGEHDPLRSKLDTVIAKLADVKKLIVATTEGGAITGELRIREHLDDLYGALRSWEGRPARYQLDRIDVLKKELGDANKAFDELVLKDVRGLDSELQQHKLKPVPAVSELDGEDALDDVAIECVKTLGAACGADADKAATERD